MEKKLLKNTLALLLTFALIFLYTPVFGQTLGYTFSDIQGHWAKSCIEWMSYQKIFAGYPDGTFRPQALMTRGEFAAAFCNLLKIAPDESVTLPGLPKDHWASKYVGALLKKGIIDEPTDQLKNYDINGNITRMEIARIMVHTSPKATAIVNNDNVYYPLAYTFRDYNNLSPVDQRYVGLLNSAYIIKGYPEERLLKMNQPATRAEIAALLEKFMSYQDMVNNPVAPKQKEPQTGILNFSYYVNMMIFPQTMKRYSPEEDLTSETSSVTYNINNISFITYDTYSDTTIGYNAEYKELMDRYMKLWMQENQINITASDNENTSSGGQDSTGSDTVSGTRAQTNEAVLNANTSGSVNYTAGNSPATYADADSVKNEPAAVRATGADLADSSDDNEKSEKDPNVYGDSSEKQQLSAEAVKNHDTFQNSGETLQATEATVTVSSAGNAGEAENNTSEAALSPLAGKDIIVVEYEIENNAQEPLVFRHDIIKPWLMGQWEAEIHDLGKTYQTFLFDNYQLDNWENKNDPVVFAGEDKIRVVAFYLSDSWNDDIAVSNEYLANVKYIGLYVDGMELLGSTDSILVVEPQSIIFKLEG